MQIHDKSKRRIRDDGGNAVPFQQQLAAGGPSVMIVPPHVLIAELTGVPHVLTPGTPDDKIPRARTRLWLHTSPGSCAQMAEPLSPWLLVALVQNWFPIGPMSVF